MWYCPRVPRAANIGSPSSHHKLVSPLALLSHFPLFAGNCSKLLHCNFMFGMRQWLMEASIEATRGQQVIKYNYYIFRSNLVGIYIR